MGLLFSTSGAYAVENGIFIIQQKAVVLPDVFRECLQLAAIEVEQPPAALAHHVGVQVAVVVVADILVAGGRTLRGGEATQLPGGRQALQVTDSRFVRYGSEIEL